MSLLGKIIGVMMAKRTIADVTPMFHRLLVGIAAIVVLSILSSLLAGVLMLGLIYAAFTALVNHGLEPEAAMMIIGAVIVILTAFMVNQIFVSIKKIKHIPAQVLPKQNPLADRATKAGYAFIDGFMSGPPATPTPTEPKRAA